MMSEMDGARMRDLTEEEWAVIELLAEATNAFAALPDHHPSDLREWAHEVHHLQYRVMARAVTDARVNPRATQRMDDEYG